VSNTTATGGYLGVTSTPINIHHLIHDQICGILGMGNTYVRPKNQPNPPPPPPFGTDWVAFGTSQVKAQGFAHIDENAVSRQENFIVTASIYGDSAESNARNLRDGLEIRQNWEQMQGFSFGGSMSFIRVPELHNGRWLQRYDLTYAISQNSSSAYNILTVERLSDVSIDS